MTEQEKVAFLSEKVKELNKITSEIEALFPEKSFKFEYEANGCDVAIRKCPRCM